MSTIHIILMIFGSVLSYAFIGGISAAIWNDSDEGVSAAVAIFWPLALPSRLAYIAVEWIRQRHTPPTIPEARVKK